jgi:GxxExxY protein
MESDRFEDGVQYRPIPAEWNELSGGVIRCAIEVHRALGPGLLEKIYEEALCYELELNGIRYERQRAIRLQYKGRVLPEQRMDLIIEGLIIVELKSIDQIPEVHLAQLVSYLRSADIPLGLLINFNVPLLKKGLHRRLNPLASAILALPTLPEIAAASPSSLLTSESSGSSGTSEFSS